MSNFIHIEDVDLTDDVHAYWIYPIDLDHVIYFYRSSNNTSNGTEWQLCFNCKDKEPTWRFKTREKRELYYQKVIDYTQSVDLTKTIKI